jgi:hypothetical protein
MEATLKRSSEELTDAIVEAVIKQAAFSVGIQIALLFVPVIGWALSGLISLVQMITGKYYQRQMQDVIDDTIAEIKARGDASEKRLTAIGRDVFAQELPAGRALAMSTAPLEGLGENMFERLGRNVGQKLVMIARAPKKQEKLFTDLATFGLRPMTKAVLNVPLFAAKRLEVAGVVKQGTLTKPLTKVRETGADMAQSFSRFTNPMTTTQETTGLAAKWGSQAVAAVFNATGNEKAAEEALRIGNKVHAGAQETMAVFTPTGSYNLFTGREGLVTAREQCDAMRASAFAQIDKMTADGVVKIQSPECRAQMRVGIAKALRQDPTFIAQMQQLRDIEEQERAMANAQVMQFRNDVASLPPPTEAPPASSGAGAAVGLAAAVAAALALTR